MPLEMRRRVQGTGFFPGYEESFRFFWFLIHFVSCLLSPLEFIPPITVKLFPNPLPAYPLWDITQLFCTRSMGPCIPKFLFRRTVSDSSGGIDRECGCFASFIVSKLILRRVAWINLYGLVPQSLYHLCGSWLDASWIPRRTRRELRRARSIPSE